MNNNKVLGVQINFQQEKTFWNKFVLYGLYFVHEYFHALPYVLLGRSSDVQIVLPNSEHESLQSVGAYITVTRRFKVHLFLELISVLLPFIAGLILLPLVGYYVDNIFLKTLFVLYIFGCLIFASSNDVIQVIYICVMAVINKTVYVNKIPVDLDEVVTELKEFKSQHGIDEYKLSGILGFIIIIIILLLLGY